MVDFARSAYFYNFAIRVPSPSRTSVPLCTDSTSLVTSLSHCHDTPWEYEPKQAPKYVHEQPSKRIWGAIGSRGASGGGPGEIMISKTSSSVRLSVHFDHSISSKNYSPSHHPIATQSASSLTAITSHHLPFSYRSYTKGAMVFFMVIISQPVLRSGVCPVPSVNCRS